jgi:hypothetical protein
LQSLVPLLHLEFPIPPEGKRHQTPCHCLIYLLRELALESQMALVLVLGLIPLLLELELELELEPLPPLLR